MTADGSDDKDVDSYFDAQLMAVRAEMVLDSWQSGRVWFREAEYMEEDLTLGKYLETLERPSDMTDDEYRKLRNKSRNFLVHDGLLFKRGRRRWQPPRRVLGLPTQRREATRQLHDECGHRGIRPTFEQVARRYQWRGMWEDVKEFCQSCEECQRRSRLRYEEPLHPTFTTIVWEKIGVDVV